MAETQPDSQKLYEPSSSQEDLGFNPLVNREALDNEDDEDKVPPDYELEIFKKARPIIDDSLGSNASLDAYITKYGNGDNDLDETEMDLDDNYSPDLENFKDSGSESEAEATSPVKQKSTPQTSSLSRTTSPSTSNLENSVNSKVTSPQILKIVKLVENMVPQVAKFDDTVDKVIANQKLIHCRILELTNEVQRSKLYAKTLQHQMTKELSDRDYEKSNLVLYNLDLKDWKTFFKMHNGCKIKAANAYGYRLVNKFMPNIRRSDINCYKLFQNCDKNGKKLKTPLYWRIMIKLPHAAYANTLRIRLAKAGINDVRPGLSKNEREIASLVQQRIEEWNSKLDDNSPMVFIRRHVFHIHEVQRKNTKKLIKIHDSLEDAEKYFNTELAPLNLKEIPFLGKVPSSNGTEKPATSDKPQGLKEALTLSGVLPRPSSPNPRSSSPAAPSNPEAAINSNAEAPLSPKRPPQQKKSKAVSFRPSLQPSILSHLTKKDNSVIETPVKKAEKRKKDSDSSPSGPPGPPPDKKKKGGRWGKGRTLTDEEKAARNLKTKEAKRKKAEQKKKELEEQERRREEEEKNKKLLVHFGQLYEKQKKEIESLKGLLANSSEEKNSYT